MVEFYVSAAVSPLASLAVISLIFWPILAAVLVWALARRRESLAWPLAFGAVAVEFVLALLLSAAPELFAGTVSATGTASAAETAVASSSAAGILVSLPFLNGGALAFELDGFRRVYLVIIAFMWLMTTALAREYFHGHGKKTRYWFFTLMTLGATMGVFLARTLYSAFLFFEVMSFTSFVWVIQEETPGAIRAAGTYLAVAVIGGLTALMGIFLVQHACGTTELEKLAEAIARAENPAVLYTAGGCILFGFGAKAGMFPLHIWLPKAHPVAPAPASALLSGVLTKSGIWGVLALSCYVFRDDARWGAVILGLGCVTMLLGAVLALFSVDLKRTLACSSLSQIGFILVGVGMMGLLGEENALAARGTLLHMLNHSLFKLVLFLCAGAVYMKAHTLDLTRLRGFGRGKPLLLACFLLGAAGIAGSPGLNGYISKTLLHESIVEGQAHYGAGLVVVEWIFLISGGLTLAYMTKLFVCLFVEKGEDDGAVHEKHSVVVAAQEGHSVNDAAQEGHHSAAGKFSALSSFALGGSAILLPALGLTAPLTMDGLATLGTDFFHAGQLEHAVHYYSLENLKGGLISIAIGCAIYLTVVRRWMIRDGRYVNRWPAWLDLEDGLYRPLLLKWLPALLGGISRVFAENLVSRVLARGVMRTAEHVSVLFAENRVTGPVAHRTKRFTEWASQLFADNVITQALARGVKRAAEILLHFFSDSLDAVVLLLHRTIFRPLKVPDTDRVHHTLSYRLGAAADRIAGTKEPAGEQLAASGQLGGEQLTASGQATADADENSRAHRWYQASRTFRKTTHELADSVSFALLLLAGAICVILIYVMVLRG